MGTTFNVAVILLRNRSTDPPPAVADVRRYFRDDRSSVARFWGDATYGWVTFPRMDFFGWYDVNLPDSTRRSAAVQAGRASASGSGVDLRPYDRFVTVVFGAGLDSGATGDRTSVSVKAPDPHHFVAHEFGHMIGFDHSFGIPTGGSDWNGDGVVDLNPVYGDPYCIMSGMTFGGANPTFDLAARHQLPALSGLPNAWQAGPPPSRACVHFHARACTSRCPWPPRWWARSGTCARWPARTGPRSTWPVVGEPDRRCWCSTPRPSRRTASVGSMRNTAGRTPPSTAPGGTPAWPRPVVSWTEPGWSCTSSPRRRRAARRWPGTWVGSSYRRPTWTSRSPRPPDPSPVSIAETDVLDGGRPSRLQVRFSRAASRSVSLIMNSSETRAETRTELRPHPDWPLLGQFTWEHRDVTRTARYRPFVLGLGGSGPFEGASPVRLGWRVGGVAAGSAQGVVGVPIPGRPAPVQVSYLIDPASRQLNVANRPSDGAYDLTMTCTASADTDTGDVAASGAYSAEEGWGADYYAFVDWWADITNPIPIEVLPPRWWLRRRIDRAIDEVEVVQQVNPELAEVMKVVTAEVARVTLRQRAGADWAPSATPDLLIWGRMRGGFA